MGDAHEIPPKIVPPTGNIYYFTFGFGHHQGRDRRSLKDHYTTIAASTEGEARSVLTAARGGEPIWAFSYDSAEEAGIEKHELRYIPIEEVLPQDGPNI